MAENPATREDNLEYLKDKINMEKLLVILERFRRYRENKEEIYLSHERDYKIITATIVGPALRKVHTDPKGSREELIAVITGKNEGQSVVGGLNNLLSFRGYVQRDDFRVMLEKMDDQEYQQWLTDLFDDTVPTEQRFSAFRSRVNQRYTQLFERGAFATSKQSKPNLQAGFVGVLLYCYDPKKYCLYKPTDYAVFINDMDYRNISGTPGKKYKLFLDFAKLLVQEGKDHYRVNDLTDAHNLIYLYGYEPDINPGPEGENGGGGISPGSRTGTFIDFTKSKGFQFDEVMLKNYILSLKTKPFVILSGISGTGKTKIAQFFAQYMNGSKGEDDRTAFISVRPDWMDNRGLLGYYNPVTQEYQVTELLKLLLKASRNPQAPYFVILDEMNISKVEYYFSDFLSCLESRYIAEDCSVEGEALVLHDETLDNGQSSLTVIINDQAYDIPPRLEIPVNVYFTGTVNIDETTYFFSPKVLDRANVIEFNEINLEQYKETLTNKEEKRGVAPVHAGEDFIKRFTDDGSFHKKLIDKTFKMDYEADDSTENTSGLDMAVIDREKTVVFDEIMDECYGTLQGLNKILRRYHLHFGYRVVDEVLYYLKNASEMNYFEPIEAMDYQITQKLLTKLHGNRKNLEQPLQDLFLFLFRGELDEEKNEQQKSKLLQDCLSYYTGEKNGPENSNEEREEGLTVFEPSYKKSAAKVYRMMESLNSQGYTSFME